MKKTTRELISIQKSFTEDSLAQYKIYEMGLEAQTLARNAQWLPRIIFTHSEPHREVHSFRE